MTDVTKAVYDRLTGSAELTALLALYGADPAVFTSPLVPDDAVGPYIWSPPNASDVPADSKNAGGRTIIRDIHIVTTATEDHDALESTEDNDTIAALVVDLFHRQAFDIDSVSTVIISSASGPTLNMATKEILDQVVSVRMTYTK